MESDELVDETDNSGDDDSVVEMSYDVSGTLNGYGYVDLGLSVVWATCNIGADCPIRYGGYYAWGEIETKDSYTSSNSVTYGANMSDISGNSEYDVATANLGSTWRMPTSSEFDELVSNCTWTWTTIKIVNGKVVQKIVDGEVVDSYEDSDEDEEEEIELVKCYEVTGANGNSIFLPAAGYYFSSSLNSAASYGSYWSSSPETSSTSYAYYLSFYEDDHVGWYYLGRYFGRSVRPVSE